jgi:hypothetical protein
MGAMEDAANIFSADLQGRSAAPQRGEDSRSAPEPLFDNNVMEGADSEEGGADEGGDYAEEQRARRPAKQSKESNDGQRRGDDGRFLKNEGPIDDDDEGEGGESDEGEGEGEGEEEGDESGEEGTAKPGSYDPEAKVTVKVDGQDKEVTLKEALEGYIRTDTFHRRMTALDGDKQVVDRDRATYQTGLQTLENMYKHLSAEIKALEPAEPDWDKLYRENPNEAARQKIMWDRYKDGRAQLQKQQEEITQRQQQEHQANLRNYITKEGQKLLTKFPHWNDAKARDRDQAAIKSTLKAAGFSDSEIATVCDSRMVEIAMKAARFDRLSSRGIQPKRSTTRPMPSGSAASSRRSGSAGGNRAARAHAVDQSVDSAVGVFSDLLSREK